MERNLDRRVEALVRIKRSEHKAELGRQFDQAFREDIARWELHEGTNWIRIADDGLGIPLVDLQESEIKLRRMR
jgi:polyphosphate kinase